MELSSIIIGFQLFVEAAIGGAIAAIGLFASHLGLDRHRKPKLILDSNSNKYQIRNIMFVNEEIDNKTFARNTRYSIQRIKIRNGGRSAAENCKAILIIGDEEYKLIWKSTQKEDVTINKNSYEYLDVCAILLDNIEDVYQNVKSLVGEIDETISSYQTLFPSTPIDEAYVKNLTNLKDKIKNSYPGTNQIRNIILPSDTNGWNGILKDYYWEYKEGFFYNESKEAEIIVTSKNANPLKFKIKINQQSNNDGNHITFVDNQSDE